MTSGKCTRMIDFHCHILPEFDDGSSSCDMSLKMLELEKQQGVDTVVLTPHFYIYKEEPEHFIKRRHAAALKLANAMKEAKGNYPRIKLGAEVAMSKALCYEDLRPFCINGTKTFLLELPFEPMGSWFRDVEALINQNRVQIVLAHVERFRDSISNRWDYNKVLGLRVMKQINTSSLIDDGFFAKRQLFKMIENEDVHILGTDAHNLSDRPVNMDKALKVLEDKGFRRHIHMMMENAEKLI